MKFHNFELPELVKKIDENKIQGLLLYGVNQGFAKTVVDHIAKKQNLLVKNFDAKEINHENLGMLSRSLNFFGQKELIKITEVISPFNKKWQDFFSDNSFSNLICFVSSQSLPLSGIRKFFENSSNLASMGCYYDNEQTITKIILQQSRKQGKSIDDEALFYLRTHLKGDHQIIKSELEKLFAFTSDKDLITYQDAISSLSNDLMANADHLCIFFAKKEPNEFINELENLKQQGKNEVLIIRSLIRYYINIYITAKRIENGDNIDYAIKSLSPPIFFKYVSDFKQIMRRYNSKDALTAIDILQKAEMNYKSNSKSFDLFETYLMVNQG